MYVWREENITQKYERVSPRLLREKTTDMSAGVEGCVRRCLPHDKITTHVAMSSTL